MISPNIGDRVRTKDGHHGTVVKRYRVTGVSTPYVHIQESDGRIWYCPESDIVTQEGGYIDAQAEKAFERIMDEILHSVSNTGRLRGRR